MTAVAPLTLIALAVLSTGCRASEPDSETPERLAVPGSIRASDGTQRTFHVYVPTWLVDDGPAPLLIALHGGTGWGQQFESQSGLSELAEEKGFIVVYPDGTRIGLFGRGRVWNGGTCCRPASEDSRNVDDVAFIRDLIAHMEHEYRIDPAAVFVTGQSNGAILAYRLACQLSERIAAVAFQAGSLEIDSCRPARPVSVLHIHGAADANLPLEGGTGRGISDVAFNSPIASVETIARLNGCQGYLESTDPANPDVVRRSWEGCDDGTTVEMIVVAGAGHAWMGRPSPLERLIGPAYQGFDSSRQVWSFLESLQRP